MKVIFLDIDGVLNTERGVIGFLQKNEEVHDEYGHKFDIHAVKHLKDIIDKTGAKIVVSSSWRWSGIQRLKDMWKSRNLPGEIIDVTFSFDSTNFKEQKTYLDKSKAKYHEITRGVEIDIYLKTHPDITNYLIIDDDTDMLDEQLPYFINVNEMFGITAENVSEAIQILNKQ